MYFDRKATSKYLRRRHKLYKAVTNYLHGTETIPISQTQKTPQKTIDEGQNKSEKIKNVFIDMISLLESQNLDIFIFLETIQPVKNHLLYFSKQFMSNILIAIQFQSGRKLAYILYRLCKKNPELFRQFNSILRTFVIEKYKRQEQFNIEQCIFLTDLFLYGFYFTARGYLERIFFHCQNFIIDFIPRMPPINEWSVFIPKKYLFKLKNLAQNWINNLIRVTKAQYEQLLALQQKIKQILVQQKTINQTKQVEDHYQKDKLRKEYVELYQKYESTRQKLQYIEKNQGLQEAKQLQKVVEQCSFFDPMFRLPTLLYNLYVVRVLPNLKIQRVKPSQMLNLYDDQAFIGQLRQCSTIQKAVDLASYFIANLSTQRNRQELIEFIIDYCHNEGNLDLIMKVIAQINCIYSEIRQHLTKKASKIASQIKMNKKYLNLICQSIKYKLIPSDIILSYIQRRLLTEHTEMSQHEIMRQCCSILQLLGQGIYHQSLENNISINKLLRMIEDKIVQKKLGNQFMFNLKCVKNYLRKAHCLPDYLQNAKLIKDSETLSQLTQDYNLHDHFDFILKRIKQLLHSKTPNNKTQQVYNKKRIINYIVNSIQNESNFIQTFLQASLVKQINHKEIKQEVLEKCVQKIQSHIGNDIQHAVKWSRFLGQLYNYEIINRKQLSSLLQTKLLYSNELSNVGNFQQMAKCIIQCLNISKSYIMDSQLNKQANQYIVNFLIKFKRSVLKYLLAKINKGKFDNIMIEQEVGELLQSFHPTLVNKLKTIQQIDLWVQKVKFSSPKDTLLSLNLYKILNSYQQVDKSSQFDPTFLEGPKKSYRKQQPTNNKNKKPLYKQKVFNIQNQQISTKPMSYTQKTSYTSIQQIQKQIQEINENFRNQESQEITEEQKQIIKSQQKHLEATLKEMMGITPQIQLNEKFPELNQKNLKLSKKTEESNITLNNMRKILKNSNGKKMKIIARKVNQVDFQVKN